MVDLCFLRQVLGDFDLGVEERWIQWANRGVGSQLQVEERV